MDNKNNTSIQDDIRVDSKDPSEVEYLHQQYPAYSHQQIKEAIVQYGPIRRDIVAFLDKK